MSTKYTCPPPPPICSPSPCSAALHHSLSPCASRCCCCCYRRAAPPLASHLLRGRACGLRLFFSPLSCSLPTLHVTSTLPTTRGGGGGGSEESCWPGRVCLPQLVSTTT
eukprot:COSAG01_NODE_908_length_12794_cov_119.794171_3_plen_109_part_00